jgi:hypothetical protein
MTEIFLLDMSILDKNFEALNLDYKLHLYTIWFPNNKAIAYNVQLTLIIYTVRPFFYLSDF